ncbi:GTP-binding protein HflX [Psychromonas ingrahamii 37]|uniref:GTPase HflX n=1 Tax=Psychromonas ingrahamii (strain DSM 17664 / CCUG 51855 / 37) TaxID=357804 RepID=A1SZK9_PSYIN|nr:ribosome rescue GTPase HflX [Psychromonas ingrahamii]ABM04924.1 GTP-binding protein HflX [Psychromonas ingrahamii 37]
MFDRYEAGELAVLVHITFSDENKKEDLDELKHLVSSAGVNTLDTVTGSRQAPHARYFVGTGKAQEIADAVKTLGANVVVFNHALTPAQQRNLEALCECLVLDRTALILDIFAQRARTYEGRLQVELAQLRYLSTRLIRGWTHLERQKGGIGLRGPGETQLETDRRLLRARISTIKSRLAKVEKQREQGRRARKRNEVPTVALVGYTNAGKSTLFNHLTDAGVYAADQLFATLDPTLRKVDVVDVGTCILADTVGFIRHLPHDLVAAFKATLQETRDATLLLHIVDCADPSHHDNIVAVQTVLDEIDAGDVPQLMIMNKIDDVDGIEPYVDFDELGKPVKVWLSAQTGIGVELLFESLTTLLSGQIRSLQLAIPSEEGKLRALFYQLDCIEHESYSDNGDCILDIRLNAIEWQRLIKQQGASIEEYVVNAK